MRRRWSCWIGAEPREAAAFAVARHSLIRHRNVPVPVYGLVLDDLKAKGLYRRPTRRIVNCEGRWQLWDEISQAPCSTEFSISRFLVPHLAKDGLAMFMDCDVVVRADVTDLFAKIDNMPPKAVWCVKHNHIPQSSVKMDGQEQTRYSRKNWSSVMVFDCDHPANKSLTVELVNTAPGRYLHQFCWLDDNDIGELDPKWNWLAGHSDPSINPAIVHHTDGSPCLPGYENAPYADEWRMALNEWAR